MGNRTAGTGSVYKERATGRWIGEAFIDGKRRRVKAASKVEASRRIIAMIAAAERGIAVGDGRATTSELIALWRNRTLANRSLSPSARTNYEWALGALDAELGKVRLRALDIDRIERSLDAIATGERGRGRPLSQRSLKLMRSTLAQVLDVGVRRRMLAGNPARDAELTPSAARLQPRRALASADAVKLYDELDEERLGVAFQVMLATSMRPGEVYGLCWDAVDLRTGHLVVRRAVQVDHGRARLVEALKTDGSERPIVVPARALAALRAQRSEVTRMKLAATSWPEPDPGLCFPTTNGNVWNPKNARVELTRACKLASVPRVTPGELRHTAKAALDEGHVAPHVIRDLMGHTTQWMQDNYGKRAQPPVDGHVAVMDELFGPAGRVTAHDSVR